MAKGNIRSMRFSDEILQMIESQPGDTFTAKFEALVTKCVWELPQKERELAQVKQQIENERKNLRVIRDKRQKIGYDLTALESRMTTYLHAIDSAIRDIEEM